MSEDNKVSQPQNDVQEAEVKQPKTDEIKEEAKSKSELDKLMKERIAE